MSSDYATLANDSDTTTITVSIPATSIAVGATQLYTGTAALGEIGSPIEYDINYSMNSKVFKANVLQFIENDSTINQYQGNIFVYKSAANTVTVRVVIFNSGDATITKTARTVTVRVRTFIPPFA